MKVDGLKSSVKEKYQKQKVLNGFQLPHTGSSFPIWCWIPGAVTNVRWSLHTGIRRCGSYTACWAGPRSLPAVVHMKKCCSRSASYSLYIIAVRGWCGLNRMCPSAWAYTLTQHLGLPHSHPPPQFFHKQNMKRCVCSGWCWARQTFLQILMQRVQSPLRIFHLTVHCWHHDGTGKQGPHWWTWPCRR